MSFKSNLKVEFMLIIIFLLLMYRMTTNLIRKININDFDQT